MWPIESGHGAGFRKEPHPMDLTTVIALIATILFFSYLSWSLTQT